MVHTDGTVIQHRPVQHLDANLCVYAAVIHNEAEATGGLVSLVQPHDHTLDVTHAAEHIVHLFLTSEEAGVADVDGG